MPRFRLDFGQELRLFAPSVCPSARPSGAASSPAGVLSRTRAPLPACLYSLKLNNKNTFGKGKPLGGARPAQRAAPLGPGQHLLCLSFPPPLPAELAAAGPWQAAA